MNTTTLPASSAARDAWDRSAEAWAEYAVQLDAWLQRATAAMIEMAGVVPGAAVLDVAAGAGDPALEIARRVGANGRVLATDLSPALTAIAQRRATAAGLAQLQTLAADAQALELEPGHFDAAVCRLGLMLMPEPERAVRAVHRALRPGARFCAMVFGTPPRNPCLGILVRTACEHAGLPPPDPQRAGGLLSLGGPGRLDEVFRAAGFTDVATTWLDAPFHWPTARDYVEFVRRSAAPIVQLVGRLGAAEQQAAWDAMAQRLAVFDTPSGWVGPNELALTCGRR
jgi:ubiquinone/menaquinone biosynthesis C-methylase UbiE